jgi:hypothetical protein
MPMIRFSVSAVMKAPRTGPNDRLYGNRIVLSMVRANSSAPSTGGGDGLSDPMHDRAAPVQAAREA